MDPTAILARACALLALLVGPAFAGGEESAEAPSAGAAPVAESCVDRAITAIQGRYEETRDLSARFEQTTRSVALGAGATASSTRSSGDVVFAKPGKMRWTYREPEPSEVVSDGKTLWLYDPAHREVQRLEVGEEYISGAAIQFLLGEGDMKRDFRIRELACRDDAIELELVPLAPASYEKLEIEADPSTGDLRRTKIFDIVGNVTEVAFRDIRVNVKPAETTFRFEVPDGVRVIEP